jgi:hypothetical protein
MSTTINTIKATCEICGTTVNNNELYRLEGSTLCSRCVGEGDTYACDYTSIQERISDLIMVDTSAAYDEFRHLMERGLDPHLLDDEYKLEQKEEQLVDMRRKYRELNNTVNIDNEEKKKKLIKRANRAKQQIAEIEYKLDYTRRWRESETSECPTDAEATESYLRMYVEKLKYNELFDLKEILSMMLEDKGIYWAQFVKLMAVVTSYLVYKTPNHPRFNKDKNDNIKEAERFKKMWMKMREEQESVPLDTRMHGEMALDIEAVLDDKWAAERIAQTHGGTWKEVYIHFDKE